MSPRRDSRGRLRDDRGDGYANAPDPEPRPVQLRQQSDREVAAMRMSQNSINYRHRATRPGHVEAAADGRRQQTWGGMEDSAA